MNRKVKIEIGILYLCIHKKLEERINLGRIYPKKEFFRIMGETFHVPKHMRIIVLKEMQSKGLIKDLGCKKNNNIYVNKIDIDMEKDMSKLYELAGIFD
jgi:hypothetical protein